MVNHFTLAVCQLFEIIYIYYLTQSLQSFYEVRFIIIYINSKRIVGK